MKLKKIKELFEGKLQMNVKSVVDSSHGVDHTVKIVETDKGKYVLKKPGGKKSELNNAVLASKMLIPLKIPVPEVIYHSDNILVESFIEGIPIKDAKLSKLHKLKTFEQFGKYTKKVHSIKMSGFGTILNGRGGDCD